VKHVLVITKATPDTGAAIDLDAAGMPAWGAAALVVNPWDEYAITEAIILKEKYSVRTTILAIGPEADAEALRQALAIGIEAAVRVWDTALSGQDSLGYARAAAAAVRKLDGVDVILFGKEFADAGSDAHIFQLARLLGWTAFGGVSQIDALDFAAGSVALTRQTEIGSVHMTARLPCVLAVLKGINEPRYPSFINIRKAAKAVIPIWSCADLGLDPSQVGGAGASIVTDGFRKPPIRSGTVEIITGADEAEKARTLVTKLIDAQVL